MRARSLRLRLFGVALLAMLAALALAWAALSFLFSRHVERSFAEELRQAATMVAANIDVAPDGELLIEKLPADGRFGTPASGLYWQVSRGTELERSRSLWDQALDRGGLAGFDGWSSRYARGPFERDVLIVERQVRLSKGGPGALVQVAQDARTLHIAREHFGRESAAFLALLWLALAAAAWVQVGAGLRPLRRLRTDVAAMRRRPDQRLATDYPSEVEPLIDAINALADARQDDVRRARQRAADLAHAMKTPIAALSAQSRRLAAADGGGTEGLDRAIASVAAAVEAELARARAAASRQQARDALASPTAAAQRLIAVLERTEKGGRTDFVIELPDDFRLRLDEADLTEILGALLENASRHARRQVVVSGGPDGEGGRIVIEDDGAGMTDEEIVRVAARGIRLDERGGGHGLGVSIARELTEATDGTLTMSRASAGGLRVELAWAD